MVKASIEAETGRREEESGGQRRKIPQNHWAVPAGKMSIFENISLTTLPSAV
jgi:hypothetical protein